MLRGDVMNLKIYLVLILILVPLISSAEEDVQLDSSNTIPSSYGWLYNVTLSKNWDLSNIRELSFAILALNKDYDTKEGVKKLNYIKNAKNCWPKSSCNVIDTSLAILALKKSGQDVSSNLDWLSSVEQASSFSGGNWLLQITSTQSGNCKLVCEDGSEKAVNTDTLTNVDGLCGSIANKRNVKFNVDCVDVGGVVDISLIYRINSADKVETFLIYGVNSDQATIILDNTCFPKDEVSTVCDLESTLYASWVLNEIGEENKIHTIPYLTQKINDNPVNVALLYLIKGIASQGEWLQKHQNPSGSFSDRIYDTSIVSYSLIQNGDTDLYLNATNWINKKQKNNNWNENILDTAVALIALYGEIPEAYVNTQENVAVLETNCNDGIDDDLDGKIDCNDPDCFDSASCSGCSISKGDKCESDSDCPINKKCSSCLCADKSCSEKENVDCGSNLECGLDEYCNQELCTCEKEVIEEIPIEEPISGDGENAKSNLLLWIFLAVLSLVILFLIFYYFRYVKKGKGFRDFKGDLGGLFKKKPKKSFEQHVASRQTRPVSITTKKQVQTRQPVRINRTSPKQDRLEMELEKSLKEAKKLLGK